MLEFLQTGKALSVLAAIGMIGFVSKLITRSLYKRLLKETDNMAMTRNKNLQNLKQRLENTCRLGQNIVNTQAYLDKQIDGFSFLHISLDCVERRVNGNGAFRAFDRSSGGISGVLV